MTRLKDNIFKGTLLLLLFFSLLLKSCIADGQDQGKYLGYEISAGLPSNSLISNIPQLQTMKIAYAGMRVGGVLAKQWVKYKATVGLHYSSASLPYSFDLLTGSMTAQLYPLKLNGRQYPGTVQPYVVGGVQQNQTKYFGTYLDPDRTRNYSKSREPLQGITYSSQVTGGVGMEYQLEGENNSFIHFFSELNYGLPVYKMASSEALAGTRIRSVWAIMFGINFGITKKS